ncbi:uncharacterized protein K452DRAFT_267394 [Aplosporella prunicola CBS 121167]|uniref:Uncharacterized protein n=1 Tax=Aplosporella prunicola CBS 121167 TaxID=1176127 RepID=A0A6A6BLB6_9PEZI|nr:uncharacterized protein K452DRAFT_267394 [Aplosporella prunicola CBS 121167]KAF2144183.1 hypothetical protein K452DRAFT_267394 [Aplosporella prunicola CBS 121167]
METAPLTLAHAHARNASAETWKANSSQASDEHQQAAGEFSKAAKDTGDAEALRILRLLESHHHRLASIISSKTASAPTAPQPEPSQDAPSPDVAPPAAATPAAQTLSPKRNPHSPNKAAPRRKPLRDSTSSIASNLATARGIPGSQRRPAAPAISVQNADGRIFNRADRSVAHDARREGAHHMAKAAADASSSPQASRATEGETSMDRPSKSDEGFKRFFSTFETVYSALSAPLAFAGLPLMAEETPQPPAPQKLAARSSVKHPSISIKDGANVKSESNPDPSTFLSKATLKALEGTPGSNFGRPAESFYVVPTTGGTVSYAGILNHSGSQGHNMPSPIIEEEGSFEGDEFVDANEEPAPPSPKASRTGHRTRPGSAGSAAAAGGEVVRANTGGKKTMEELELENNMMRQLLDKLSKRLHMWEASSQSQSLALAQSFRAQRPSQASPPTVGGSNQSDTNMEQRLRELEILVESMAREKELTERENEKVTRENEKLLSVLGRYREKWEVLKAGARGRRERGTNGGNGAVGNTSGGAVEAEVGGGGGVDE